MLCGAIVCDVVYDILCYVMCDVLWNVVCDVMCVVCDGVSGVRDFG